MYGSLISHRGMITLGFLAVSISCGVPNANAQDRRPPAAPPGPPSENVVLYLPRTEHVTGSTMVQVSAPITDIAIENPQLLKAEPISDTTFRLTPIKTGQSRVTVHGDGGRVLYDKLVMVDKSKRVEMYIYKGDPYHYLALDCSPACRPGEPKSTTKRPGRFSATIRRSEATKKMMRGDDLIGRRALTSIICQCVTCVTDPIH